MAPATKPELEVLRWKTRTRRQPTCTSCRQPTLPGGRIPADQRLRPDGGRAGAGRHWHRSGPRCFLDALSSIVDLGALRWIWVTHDDADHTGSVQQVMEAAPNARLACNAFVALRMATWWPIPLDRVHAIRVGDRLPIGGRRLRAVAPPLFDNPTSTGFVDESTGALFSVDSFGALIPEPTQSADDVPPEALAGGMAAWATLDSPWSHLVDRQLFGGVLNKVRALAPSRIFSSHLPAANGASLEQFLGVLQSVPDAAPAVPPSQEEFGHLVAAITAAGPPA